MKTLTAKDIKLMGDKDPKYGQTYWGIVEEQDHPVMFNLMDVVDIVPGAQISAEEYVMKESAKGTEYMRLKKVKVEGGRLAQTEASGDITSKLDAIHGDLKLVLSFMRQLQKESIVKHKDAPDNVVTDIGDGEINLDDIPF